MPALTYLIRKRSDLTDQQFRNACDRYAASLKTNANALGIEDFELQQRVTTTCETCFAMSRKLKEPDIDAQVTMIWRSIDDYIAGAGSAAGIAAMDLLVAEEKRFIDLTRSQAVFLDESRQAASTT